MIELDYIQRHKLNEAVKLFAITRAINQANESDSIMQKIIPTPAYQVSASPTNGIGQGEK